MFEKLLFFIFFVLWAIVYCAIFKTIMTKVPDSSVRTEMIIYSIALNVAASMCGLFLGLS